MQIKFDNLKAQALVENKDDEEIYNIVRRATKVQAPGAQYTGKYKLYKRTKGKEGWDGNVNIFQPDGTFPTGLLPFFMETMWTTTKRTASVLHDERPDPNATIGVTNLSLRGHQLEALMTGFANKFNNLWWPRGIFYHATGAGKTELAVGMFEVNPLPTLFVVHRKTLAKQTAERFEKYDHRVGFIGDSQMKNLDSNMIVTTIQSILKHESVNDIKKILSRTAQVFFDEAHLIAATVAKGNWMVDLSNKLPNAFFRWGLTATPFMRDQYSNWLLAGTTGNVLHEVRSTELIEEGFLTPPIVKMVEAPKVHKCPQKWPDSYDHGIVLNTGRTKETIRQLQDVPKPCFVFTTQVSHGMILERAAKRAGLPVHFLHGENTTTERNRSLKMLEEGTIDAIICTTIFDEGVDFPSLKSAILAGGGQSSIKTLQRIGRGLRLHKDKNEFVVIDFIDRSAKNLQKHSQERIRTYKREGFKIEK